VRHFRACLLHASSVVMQSDRGAIQLPAVGHVFLDARRRSLSSYDHRLCIQRFAHPALVLRHPRMG